MESKERSVNVARDLVRIHKSITRGLNISIEKGWQYLHNGFPGQDIQRGYFDYAQTLAVVIHAHHLGEDEVSYPVFKQKIPGAPYETMNATHVQIATLLQDAKKSMSGWSYKNDLDALRSLLETLQKIDDQWHPHIDIEEHHFSKEAITAAMIEEEEQQLTAAIGKHSQEHAVPGAMALPFVLFNLEAEDRAGLAETMPPVVINDLIPFAWKDQWASMKPFFLE